MAITQNTYTGNGSTTNYSFTFPYLETTDIKVSVDGVATTAYTLANATTIAFTTAPANGAAIRIYRSTDDTGLAATFYPGSAIRSQDLNDNYTQILYRTQEVGNYSVQDTGSVTLAATYTFTYSPSAPTPSLSSHLATKGYIDGLVLASAIPNGDRGDITVTSNGLTWTIDPLAVTTGKIAALAVDDTKLASNSVTTAKIATGAVDGTKVSGTVAKTDAVQAFTAAQRGTYVTLTDAATIATDMSLGNNFQVTLAGNRTLGAPTNVVAGQSGIIRVVQDATGSRTLAYNSVFKFPAGTAPTLTTTANAVDLLAYHCESATRIAVRFIGDVK